MKSYCATSAVSVRFWGWYLLRDVPQQCKDEGLSIGCDVFLVTVGREQLYQLTMLGFMFFPNSNYLQSISYQVLDDQTNCCYILNNLRPLKLPRRISAMASVLTCYIWMSVQVPSTHSLLYSSLLILQGKQQQMDQVLWSLHPCGKPRWNSVLLSGSA